MADEVSGCDDVRGRTRARRDRGFSLIEVVVTITLMAVVLVPIMTAVATSVRASSQRRSAAQVETALVNAADRVNRAGQKCDYEIFVDAAVQAQGWDKSLAKATYAWYQPAAYVAGANPALGGSWSTDGHACEIPDTPTEKLVQRVTISITSPDGDVHREIQVVKSRV